MMVSTGEVAMIVSTGEVAMIVSTEEVVTTISMGKPQRGGQNRMIVGITSTYIYGISADHR